MVGFPLCAIVLPFFSSYPQVLIPRVLPNEASACLQVAFQGIHPGTTDTKNGLRKQMLRWDLGAGSPAIGLAGPPRWWKGKHARPKGTTQL